MLPPRRPTYVPIELKTRRNASGRSHAAVNAQIAPELEAVIKTADQGAAFLEATRLAGFDPAEARRFFGRHPSVSATVERDYLKPWPAETAQARYLERIKKLAAE